jgi:hypothetical protein
MSTVSETLKALEVELSRVKDRQAHLDMLHGQQDRSLCRIESLMDLIRATAEGVEDLEHRAYLARDKIEGSGL